MAGRGEVVVQGVLMDVLVPMMCIRLMSALMSAQLKRRWCSVGGGLTWPIQ